ncbi:putative Cytochrome c oxidase biogenesis protein Cmc1 like [Leishmania naiffi]|uniref:Cytochrome c oxidase biogenesis protein Cmc1 like n=1 Tax=Leishmania naiffi TaxID=5678 RepID=A0AAW3C1R0_9TRYP
MTSNQDSFEKLREQAKEYLSKDAMKELKTSLDPSNTRARHGLLPKEFQTADEEHERCVNDYIRKHSTWRKDVYILRSYEYWKLRADYYPYIRRSDEKDNFFLRGITCHPRLSDYPMCKSVIRDYFVCRDRNPVLQIFNTCAPLKEQFCACINEVFLKNHERGDKKFNAHRDEYFEEQRSKKFAKMLSQVEESIEAKTKLQD